LAFEKSSTRKKGQEGEDLAVKILMEKGYSIVERNYFFGDKDRGEIDIIARDKDTLVFVEVKMRKSFEFGPAIDGITEKKKKQVRKLASIYLYEKNIKDVKCRFDAVIIQFKDGKFDIEHFENAF